MVKTISFILFIAIQCRSVEISPLHSISESTSQIWDLAHGDRRRQHRSFIRVAESNKECTTSLFLTPSRVETFTRHEPRRDVIKACARASTWPVTPLSASLAKSSSSGDIEVFFVVASYISNSDNAQLLNLTLSGIYALHPHSDVLIVDSYSPTPELIKKVVVYYKKHGVEYNIGEITVSRGNVESERMPGKEIGALRDAITFIETKRRRNKPPPTFVAFLLHSTGLRVGLPLVEMKELHTQQVCKMFPLDIPWFRYEKGQHLESQYGISPNLLV
jgi:hypothetical protein